MASDSHHLSPVPPPTFTFDDVEEEGANANDEVHEYSEDSADSWEDDLSEDEEEYGDQDQQQQSRHLGFLLTCLSPAMDIISVWRYPYIAYKHGGIVLLPWLVLHLLIGLPLTYLEMTLGQVHGGSGGGTAALTSMVPFLGGLTYSALALLTLQTVYHMTVVTWCLFYLFTSMQETLPWSQCSNQYSQGCLSTASLLALCNGTLTNCTSFGTNSSSLELPIARSEHYFNEVMLSVTEGLQLVGPLSWKLCLCLLCAWLFVYLDVRKGKLPIKKKAILPMLVMTLVMCVLMGKATGQEGFQNGVHIYFSYEWQKLQNFRLWTDVGTQLVLTLGLGTGMLQILGRRSRLALDLRQDAIIVACGNVVVAFFGGLVAFACLGYLAAQLETPYVKFLREEFGAAFVVFSAALTELPGAVIWAIIFFAVLTLVSLKRQRLLVLALASTLQEVLHSAMAKRYRSAYMLIVCGFMAGLGFIFIMPVGSHILLVLDLYVIGWPSLFIGLLECVAATWIYGSKRFCGDVKNLLQIKISKLWRIMWCVVTPTSTMVMLLFTILFDDTVEYNGVDFTLQARLIGWSLVTAVVLPTLVYTAYTFLLQRIRHRKKSEQQTIPTGPMTKPPHWHVLSQRRKGSITPAPKILVVKTEERTTPQHIPYGFVLTPQKDKSAMRGTNRKLNPPITQLLNTSAATLPPGSPCLPRSPLCGKPQMRLRSPLSGHKVAPLETVPTHMVGSSLENELESTEMRTNVYVTTPEEGGSTSRGDVSAI